MRVSTAFPRILSRTATLALVPALALIPAPGLAPTPAAAQGLTPEQVVSLRSVGVVALSPDGDLIAYTVSQPRDETEDRGGSYSELYIIPAGGGEATAVVRRPNSASSPQWSPDGTTLTFAARLGMHDQRQVYAVARDGSGLRTLTSSPEGVGGYAWSPDGSRLAYAERVPDPDSVADRRAGGNGSRTSPSTSSSIPASRTGSGSGPTSSTTWRGSSSGWTGT